MRLSARNVLPGTVTDVKKGSTTAHVRIDIGGGNVITAAITNEAVDDLKLKKGDKASAIIKASEIIVPVPTVVRYGESCAKVVPKFDPVCSTRERS